MVLLSTLTQSSRGQEEFGEGDEAWRFIAPVNGQRLQSPLGGFNVAIAKPNYRRGVLRVEWNSGQVGRSWEIPVDGEAFQFVSIVNGMPMEAGDYSLTLIDRLRPNELQAQILVIVESDDNGVATVPSIDSPLPGTEFPGQPKVIRLGGMTDTRLWVVLSSEESVLSVFKVEPSAENPGNWDLEIGWVYGSGVFHATTFTADPARYPLVPSDQTWFVVASDGQPHVLPPWLQQLHSTTANPTRLFP